MRAFLSLLLVQNLISTSSYITPSVLRPHAQLSSSTRDTPRLNHHKDYTAVTTTRSSTTKSRTNDNDVKKITPQTTALHPNRRSFFKTSAATTSTILTALGIPLLLTTTAPAPSFAAAAAVGTDLPSNIYYILRAKEATEQEVRLIKSGRFKDVQRANVKLAVSFIVNNYRLSDNLIAASSYLEGGKQIKASGLGQAAVQNLVTILEYFDSSDVQNLKVGNSMAGKEALVFKGLDSAKNNIEEFLSLFPADDVALVTSKIKEENELNYKEFDSSLGTIVNPNPQK